MERASETADWDEFFAAEQAREPRPLLGRALAVAGPGEGRHAVDLGCGQGIETRALLDAGWEVTAVDASGTGLRLLADAVAGDRSASERLHVVQARLEEHDVAPADLVHASFSLPYCPPERFDAMWWRIRGALRPGGVLAGQLFGVRDTWAGELEDVTFHSADQVAALLEGLDVVELTEVEEDGGSGRGPKHWHVFEVVARAG